MASKTDCLRPLAPGRMQVLCERHRGKELKQAAYLNVRSPILTKSRRFHVCSEHGTRCGHDIVYRIGSRMSGQPSCIADVIHSGLGTSHTTFTLSRYCMQATASNMLGSGAVKSCGMLQAQAEKQAASRKLLRSTCARTDESCVSTMEWMMLCGWITISMLSYDAPYR